MLRLLAELKDADTKTEAVLRSFRLPEAAYVEAREAANGSSARAVGILKRIAGERLRGALQPLGKKGELLEMLRRIERDITRSAGTVATLIAAVKALDIPEENPSRCESCGITFRGALSLAEHVYIHHDGPVPEHYLAAERLAGLPVLVDPTVEPGVVELRNRGEVVTRFSGWRASQAGEEASA